MTNVKKDCIAFGKWRKQPSTGSGVNKMQSKEKIIESLCGDGEDSRQLRIFLGDIVKDREINEDFFTLLNDALIGYYMTAHEYTEPEKREQVQVEYELSVAALAIEAIAAGVRFEHPHDLLLRG